MIATISLLAGGLGLFIYGMELASQGLEKAMAGTMRHLLSVFTRNRFLGLLIGILLTISFQSSSATMVLLVGLVKASILNLQQTLGVILGADIGTTFTVQLIAFKVDTYSLLIFAVGVAIFILGKYEKTKNWAKAVMGFGLLFYGMMLLKQGMQPLEQNPMVMRCLLTCNKYPLVLLLASMLLTALVQSSAATIAVAIALVSASGTSGAPLLSFAAAVPIIFGANIGTCATALLAAARADRRARQVAFAHLFFKVSAVALVFPFLHPFAEGVVWLSRKLAGDDAVSAARLLANAHTFFNVAAALFFIPFTQWVPAVLEKLYPKKGKERGFQPIVLNEQLVKTPSLALDQADGEIQKMGQEVLHMLAQSRIAFEKENSNLIEDVWRADQKVDLRYGGVSRYLSQLSQTAMREEDAHRTRDSFLVVEELEHIGDIISRNLMPLAAKKLERGLDFSLEGFHDIMKMHDKVRATLEQALKLLQEKNKEAARTFLARKNETSDMAYQMRLNHLERLKKGLKESLETSSIHLDVVSALSEIFNHVLGIARVVAKEDGKQVAK